MPVDFSRQTKTSLAPSNWQSMGSSRQALGERLTVVKGVVLLIIALCSDGEKPGPADG